jgi:hypothetical protein
MSKGFASEGALDALRAVRVEKFPEIPEELLVRVFELERAAQFESDRRPTEAKLRDLILNWGDE